MEIYELIPKTCVNSFCGIRKKEWEKMPVESVDVNF